MDTEKPSNHVIPEIPTCIKEPVHLGYFILDARHKYAETRLSARYWEEVKPLMLSFFLLNGALSKTNLIRKWVNPSVIGIHMFCSWKDEYKRIIDNWFECPSVGSAIRSMAPEHNFTYFKDYCIISTFASSPKKIVCMKNQWGLNAASGRG